MSGWRPKLGRQRAGPRPRSSTWPNGWCSSAGSTGSATPTWRRSSGSTKASLHYHFAGKAELGEALIERYASRFTGSLDEIDTRPVDARAKLAAYAKLYGDVLQRKRMCLCGMLAAEYQTLPKPMRSAVVSFFDDQEAWLVRVLEQGRDEGTLRFSGPASEAAQMIVGGLEGAMLVTRPYGDPARFRAAADHLLASFMLR